MQGKDLGALVGQIGADISQWEKAHKKMRADLAKTEARGQSMARNLTKSINAAAKRTRDMGRSMTMRITAPLVAMGGLAVREFGKFDGAMTKSLAIMGDVSDQMQGRMQKAARDIGRTTTLSAEQAAESFFFLASAGLDAEQSIAALPQVAKFAQAGMFDMALATDLVTDAQSALGMTVADSQQNLENMTRLTDVLAKANQLANASIEQFSVALTREAGSALKTFGKDVEEGVAVLAAFADQGIKGERAGMGLSRVIRLMTQASNNNKEAMEDLGLSVFDESGKMRNLADIVENLETSFEGMSDETRSAALESIGFTARVQGMILPLIGTSDAIRRYEKEARKAGGTTDEIAKNQLKGFNEQMGLLWDNVKDIGISFGQSLAPALLKFREYMMIASDAVANMSETVRLRILVVAGLFAAGGPLLWAIGSFVTAVTAISAPILGAFAAVSAGVALLYYQWDNLAAFFTTGAGAGVWTTIKDMAERAMTSIKTLFKNGLALITEIWDMWGAEVVTLFELAWNSIGRTLKVGFEALNIILSVLSGQWLTDWDGFTEAIGKSWENIMQAMEDQFKDFLRSTISLTKSITAKIGGALGDGMLGLMNVFGLVEDEMLGSASRMVNEGLSEMDQSFDESTKKADKLKGGVESLIDRLAQLQHMKFNLFGDDAGGAESPPPPPSPDGVETPETENAEMEDSPIVFKDVDTSNLGVGEYAADWALLAETMNSVNLEVTDFGKISTMYMIPAAQRARSIVASMNATFNQMTGQFAEGIGRMMAGTETLGGVFNTVLTSLADLAVRVGKIAMGVGFAIEGIKKALKTLNPFVAIAAGAALVAVGSWAKAALGRAAEGGGGGSSSAPRSTGGSGGGFETPNFTAPDTTTAPKQTDPGRDDNPWAGGAPITIVPNVEINPNAVAGLVSIDPTPIPDASPNLTAGMMNVSPPIANPEAGSGKLTIQNILNLDGEAVWKNQKKVDHRRRR